jgi:DNA topoisomerase I
LSAISKLRRTGIRRVKDPSRGFRYRDARGRAVTEETLARIRELRIPPGWGAVRIDPSPSADIQAIGQDVAGRWQYRYHATQVTRRERNKHERLVRFVDSLSRLRRRVARDLRLGGLPRERVLAAVVRILLTCFLRPGSARYAARNGSFGIATLRHHHVGVSGPRVLFSFPGKSKKHHRHVLEDVEVARVVRSLRRIGGPELFKFRSPEGRVVDVRRRDINTYIREVTGEDFTAKDFRTYAATLICACALARLSQERPTRAFTRSEIAAAVRETSAHLGNTPAVCRTSYIDSRVLRCSGRWGVIGCWIGNPSALSLPRSRRLERCERALVTVLTRGKTR